jgi:hypothetical protein
MNDHSPRVTKEQLTQIFKQLSADPDRFVCPICWTVKEQHECELICCDLPVCDDCAQYEDVVLLSKAANSQYDKVCQELRQLREERHVRS